MRTRQDLGFCLDPENWLAPGMSRLHERHDSEYKPQPSHDLRQAGKRKQPNSGAISRRYLGIRLSENLNSEALRNKQVVRELETPRVPGVSQRLLKEGDKQGPRSEDAESARDFSTPTEQNSFVRQIG